MNPAYVCVNQVYVRAGPENEKENERDMRAKMSQLMHPLCLTIYAWAVGSVGYLLGFAEFMSWDFEDVLALVAIVSISLGSMCFGCGLVAATTMGLRRKRGKNANATPQLSTKNLDRWTAFLLVTLLLLTTWLWIKWGTPPAVARALGVTPTWDYQTWGRGLVGLGAAVAMNLVLAGCFYPRTGTRVLLYGLGLTWLAQVPLRGYVVTVLVQAFLLRRVVQQDEARSVLSKIWGRLGIALVVIAVMGLLGGLRGDARKALEEGMRVAERWWWLPEGVQWTLAYAAGPVANVVRLVGRCAEERRDGVLLGQLLPSFVRPESVVEEWASVVEGCFENPANTVATAAGRALVEGGWMGVLLFYAALGAVGQWAWQSTEARSGNLLVAGSVLGLVPLMQFDVVAVPATLAELVLGWIGWRLVGARGKRNCTVKEGGLV